MQSKNKPKKLKTKKPDLRLYLKIHESGTQQVVAVCDEGLIGKQFENKSRGMRLDVSSRFYEGEIKSKKEIAVVLKNARSINLVGPNAIALGIELGIIDKNHVIRFGKVPHAQVFSF